MRLFDLGTPGKPDLSLSRTNTLFDAFGRARASRESNATVAPPIGPGVSINGTEGIIALGVEPLIGAASCSGGLALRALV